MTSVVSCAGAKERDKRQMWWKVKEEEEKEVKNVRKAKSRPARRKRMGWVHRW